MLTQRRRGAKGAKGGVMAGWGCSREGAKVGWWGGGGGGGGVGGYWMWVLTGKDVRPTFWGWGWFLIGRR
jgi:hypothetical protein